MTRQQRRAAARKEEKDKKATYILTREQLNQKIEEARNAAMEDAFILMLALPMNVLMDYYWPKSYKKKIPEFAEHVVDYYQMFEEGEFTLDELIDDIWQHAGIKLTKECKL